MTKARRVSPAAGRERRGPGRLVKAVLLIAWFVVPIERSGAIEPAQDEVEAGYNYYHGGGVTVQGPAVIVRKDILNGGSLKAGYNVDIVSSASIDVVTQASPYKETRKEYSLGTDILRGDTLVGVDYINSRESDYLSDTLSVALAHDLFDKNTTFSLKVARSWDQVGKNNDPAFGWNKFNRTVYSTGITQSLTPLWLIQFNYELTADEGLINNPYRSAITLDGALVPENYPDARTGQAWALRTSYGIASAGSDGGYGGIRGSVQLDYRYYQDTFDVHSQTAKITLQRYFFSDWLGGVFYQYYWQDAASFYGDRLPPGQLYKARDKELSQYHDQWVGLTLKYKLKQAQWGIIRNPYVQVSNSWMVFNYDNFTDPRTGALYSQRVYVVHTDLGFNY
ncbi:MAG TPA: DUF3570 domain-containing protein [Nitrospiria bacterium]|nr:DUF3570 domain-containing protein [Nitrospiria bacterium]